MEHKTYDVALAACDRYDDYSVEAALRQALEAIYGLSFVKPGMCIAVKVNLVTALKPDTAPVTALIHLCDREPEKTEEAIRQAEAFRRHFIRVYGQED